VAFAAVSRPFVHAAGAEELRAAIAAVTRALATTHEHDQVLALVRERAALRRELEVACAAGRCDSCGL
jgi:hypothetical protein